MSKPETEMASAKLSELNVIQLEQLNQLLGKQIDKLRADRQHLKMLIANRNALGETEALLRAQFKADEEADRIDAVAPGVMLQAKTTRR